MSAFIAAAIGTPEARIEMKKAGVARVDLDSPSAPGELKFLMRPKQAAALSG
jgi:phosphohistidine phosphatase SixA